MPRATYIPIWNARNRARQASGFSGGSDPGGFSEGLGFLGLELSEARNAENTPLISTDGCRVAVRVVRTDEELMMARSVGRVLGVAAVALSRHRRRDHRSPPQKPASPLDFLPDLGLRYGFTPLEE